MLHIAIIGGGASGLAAACAVSSALRAAAGEEGAAALASITVFEATDKVGRPILRSGNGRCNFSNACIDPAAYNRPAFVAEALASFEELATCHLPDPGCDCPNGVVRYLAGCGLMWQEAGEGRLYPLANKAQSVLEVLMRELGHGFVGIRLGARVRCVEAPRADGDRFHVRFEDRSVAHADLVVCASGGGLAPGLLPGIACEPIEPMLGPLSVRERDVRSLDAIRVRGRLSVIRAGERIFDEEGEVLFRKYGISGIVTFDASRFARPGDRLLIDLFPGHSLEGLVDLLACRLAAQATMLPGAVTYRDCLAGIVLEPVASAMLARLGLAQDAIACAEGLAEIAAILKGFAFTCAGIAERQGCQVMRGGALVDAVCPRALEAKGAKGLFVCGEALDIDGPCGGYNLHWALSTGLTCGWVMAQRILDRREEAGC